MGYLEWPDEDQPDPKIWHYPERLDEWFEAVKQRRESGGEAIPQVEEEDMTSNELTRQLIGD